MSDTRAEKRLERAKARKMQAEERHLFKAGIKSLVRLDRGHWFKKFAWRIMSVISEVPEVCGRVEDDHGCE